MARFSARYLSYMQSKTWASKRARTLKRAGYACQSCGTRTAVLHAHHHRGYARLGKERVGDLIALCQTCHLAAHALKRAVSHARAPAGRKRL